MLLLEFGLTYILASDLYPSDYFISRVFDLNFMLIIGFTPVIYLIVIKSTTYRESRGVSGALAPEYVNNRSVVFRWEDDMSKFGVNY